MSVFTRPLRDAPAIGVPSAALFNPNAAVPFYDPDYFEPEGAGAKGGKSSGGGAKGGPGNSSPRARSDSFVTDEATAMTLNVLANDSDRNGDTLSITKINGVSIAVGQSITLASGATLTLLPDMGLAYDPGSAWTSLGWNQSGSDTFSYTIDDGRGGTATASVAVTVEGIGEGPLNTAPVARSDTATTLETASVSGNVLANDSDPDGDQLVVSAVNGQSASVGRTIALASGARLTLQANGSYSYDPNHAFDHLNTGQSGTDSFSYSISDGKGGTASTTVAITVAGVSDAPSEPTPYYVDALLGSDSQRWNYGDPVGTPDTVTFAFLGSVPSYYSTSHWAYTAFRAFSASQQATTRAALDEIEDFANITFVETTDVSKAAITFGIADMPTYAGYAYYPSGSGLNSLAGDVWIDSAYAGSVFTPGSAMYKTLIHEIGHAIGLMHSEALPAAEDTRQYTVMSYNKHAGMSPEPSTYMLYDIATIQHLYGADMVATAGDDTYGYATYFGQVKTVWDAGGIDTFDFSPATANLTIDLREGRYSTVTASGSNNLAIAFGAVIENARGGSGADVIVSNEADNVLTGGAGADLFRFHAGWGNDTVTDFARGADKVDLSTTGLGFADLSLSVTADGVIVSEGADSILLAGLAALDQTDFLFGATV